MRLRSPSRPGMEARISSLEMVLNRTPSARRVQDAASEKAQGRVANTGAKGRNEITI